MLKIHPIPKILPLGDAAWTMEFGDGIDAGLNARVLGLADLIADEKIDGVVECVPTFRSLCVHFDPLRVDALNLQQQLLQLAQRTQQDNSASHQGSRWEIPVCFDDECAPDLAAAGEEKGLTAQQIINLLTSSVFPVYMLGFLPGFPYLGGVPAELDLPRLANPRSLVPERSLAITGRMAAIYPWASPGGWRLVGRTPIKLFDANNQQRPALLAAGDQIVLKAIDIEQYQQIEEQCAAGKFDVHNLRQDSEAP